MIQKITILFSVLLASCIQNSESKNNYLDYSSKEDKLSFDLLIKIHLSKIIIHDIIDAAINITITDLTTKLAFRKRVKIEVSINIKVNFSFSNIAPEEAGKV